jgi:hypothetical protein
MQKRTFHSFLIRVAVIGVMTFCFLLIPTPPAEFEDTWPINSRQTRLAGDGFDAEIPRNLFRKPDNLNRVRQASIYKILSGIWDIVKTCP